MLGATHMIVGATVYKRVPYKIEGYLLAFLAHFFLDAIPHYELSVLLNDTLAILAGMFLLLLAWHMKDLGILIAAFLGALPDINWTLNWSASLARVHSFFHTSIKPPPFFLGIEVLIILASVIFLLRKPTEGI
ncbi:hypothetical protein [Desulfosporosinus sp. SB140]|uniref:hypothetical protein n=1 Tax=Desulfosporosinus paludis TaxID=3115649 RepID=UPI003890D36E